MDTSDVYGPIDTEGTHEKRRPDAECPDSTDGEIVVCATVDNEKYRMRQTMPPPKTAMQVIGEKLNVKVGNLEVGSIDNGDGTRVIGLRLKF